MKDLIQQCKTELKRTRKMKKEASKEDQKIFSGMITDLELAIAWMETGRPPGSVKGVYGQYIGNAIRLDPDKFESMCFLKVDGTIPLDPFTEIENRLDRERQAKKRA